MFITYILIGCLLLIVGIICGAYFVNFIYKEKFNRITINSLLDSFVTIFIGICYLYCAYILSENELFTKPTLNFNNSNNIDDVAIMLNNSFDDNSNDNNFSYTTGQINSEESMEKIDENEEFLRNYQKFFENIIKQKMNNSSSYNKTIFYNNKQYKSLNPRRKRELNNNFDDFITTKCFTKSFIENAIILYSYLHCLMSLINTTILCKNCDNEEIEEDNESKGETRVQPIFVESSSSSLNDEPILELFKAKSTCKSHTEENTSPGKIVRDKSSWFTTFNIIFTILFPIIAILILYILMQSPIKQQQNIPIREIPVNEMNFNNTRADLSLLNLIQSPPNVNLAENHEDVAKIVENIYDIVNKAGESSQQQKTAPIMYDIINYLNNRQPKEVEEDCLKLEVSTKCYYFVVNVLVYFLTVFYAKAAQITLKMENNSKAIHLNKCIMSMAILWFPSVMEIYYRTNLKQIDTNIVTDICLALGNSNKIVTLIRNYLQSKKLIKNKNFVKPAP